MESNRHKCMDSSESSDFSPSETNLTSRRIVSFYPTSALSNALWPDDLPVGTDSITYPQDQLNQQLGSVTGLHAWIIEARSPLIAAAFESSVSGKRLHLDSLDSGTVLPFVRFLYTGYYASDGEDWEDVPTSVWLHCRMYYLGHLYDLADLKSQAYVNVLRQCEFGCSSPCMPIDLCRAIDFVYCHLAGHDAISDALVQYCVTRCLSHKLHENAEFRNVAFFVRAFHQDLTKVCRDRDYEDESAAIIIQLPYMHYAPATYASTEHPPISRFEDIIHHYHSTDRYDDISPKKRSRVPFDERQASPTKVLKLQESAEQPVTKLALRQASEKPAFIASEDQSTMKREAKLPYADVMPAMQQSSSLKSHGRQSPMTIFSRASSQQAAPTQRSHAWGAALGAQKMIAEFNEVLKPSAVDISAKAQQMMASLTKDEETQMRNDYVRETTEEQLQHASARQQDPFFQHIYEKAEQEAMNKFLLAQAVGGEQQNPGLPLRPALDTQIPAATKIMAKMPMRPLFPSSGDVPEDQGSHKDENLPIWKRRDMGTNSGLSQTLETRRTQEKQSQGGQSIESTASQKQGGPAMYQPKKDWRQPKVIDAEYNPTFHRVQSAQSSTPCKEVNRVSSMQQTTSTEATNDDPFRVCPEDTTPSGFVAPNAPVGVIRWPYGPISAGPNHALQDYQMQLMLLEQQNKKRLLLARQERDVMTTSCGPSSNATSTNMQPALPTTSSKLQNETDSESCPRRAYALPGVREGLEHTAAINQPPAPDLYKCDRRPEHTELGPGGGDVLDNFDFDSFLEASPSFADNVVRDVPALPQTGEARTLQDYQTQLMRLEHAHRENHPKLVSVPLQTNPLPAAMQETTRAASRPIAAAVPTGNRRQGGPTLAYQNEGEMDVFADLDLNTLPAKDRTDRALANFDFDAFLETNSNEPVGFDLNNAPFESDSEDNARSGSDSDAQSWVDVAIESTGGSGRMSPSDATTTGRNASAPGSSPTRRSPYHSDSEWELC